MGRIVNFARIDWELDHIGMTWATTCGATSNPNEHLETPYDATASLAEHFAHCSTCRNEADGLGEGLRPRPDEPKNR